MHAVYVELDNMLCSCVSFFFFYSSPYNVSNKTHIQQMVVDPQDSYNLVWAINAYVYKHYEHLASC